MMLDTIRQQLKRLEEIGKDIAEIEKRLTLWKKDQEAATRLMAIPGVGLLTATAIYCKQDQWPTATLTADNDRLNSGNKEVPQYAVFSAPKNGVRP